MVKILADSTCDLSDELKERFDIEIIPLHIILGEEEHEDGVDITPDEIYKWSDTYETTPKTSAPAIERAISTMKTYLDQGMEVVVFTISEEMSTSANVMRLAADELSMEERVFVIDSRNLSTGIGLLVLEAAEMAKDGLDGISIKEKIDELIPKVRASFVVDTLVYLHRGGRCSGLSALLGSALNLHPKIEVKDGVMGATKKYRGRMKTVIKDYARDLEPALLSAKKNRVFITHSGCDANIVSEAKKYLENLNHFDKICITRAGGVVSSHCGYGTLGILFIDNSQ